MNRRSILKGLLALPFAPLLAKAAKAAPGIPINETVDLRVTEAYVPQGSDQTSIWLVDAQPVTASEIRAKMEERMLDLQPVLESLNRQMQADSNRARTNWLKRSINGN